MTAPHIGTLAERSLHAALKAWYARPDDGVEQRVGRFVVDLVRDDLLIEIQTGNFTAIRRKLKALLPEHRVRLLLPLARDRWIVREAADGRRVSRRRSPRHRTAVDAFYELVRIPHQLAHPNLTVGLLAIEEEEVWRDDGQGSWRRRGWSVVDRRLVAVVGEERFGAPQEWLRLLPAGLERPFTNKALAAALRRPPRLAQKVTYTLCRAGALAQVGKRGRANLFDWQGS